MPDRRSIFRLRTRLLIAAAALVCSSVFGQTAKPDSQVNRYLDDRFADFNATLSNKADALLTSTEAMPVAESSKGQVRSAGSRVSPAEAAYPRQRQRQSAASERVEELRPFVAPILQERGVPPEFAAVILVESGGDPSALSPKGARGLWQLMPETARRYGLVVDGNRDDRLDPGKSTQAAAQYLSDLHAQFRSWPLALAASNTREQSVQRAVKRSGSTDFPLLSSLGLLPLETRNYVPAVLAAGRQLAKDPVPVEEAPRHIGWIGTVYAFTDVRN